MKKLLPLLSCLLLIGCGEKKESGDGSNDSGAVVSEAPKVGSVAGKSKEEAVSPERRILGYWVRDLEKIAEAKKAIGANEEQTRQWIKRLSTNEILLHFADSGRVVRYDIPHSGKNGSYSVLAGNDEDTSAKIKVEVGARSITFRLTGDTLQSIPPEGFPEVLIIFSRIDQADAERRINGASAAKSKPIDAKAELLAAVKKGDLVVVKKALAKGADVNAKLSLFDETALHLAASGGHKEIVEFLIAVGADVNRQSSTPTNDGSRRTPLDNARSQMYGGGNATPPPNLRKDHRHHKFKAIADILKKHGGHSSSIFVAVKTGDVVGVKRLLNGKVDFTKTSTGGRTPLHLAAEYGHKEIVSLLLRKGAQADSGNWSDKTALHYAAEKGHIEIIELLLSKGANVNALGGAPTGTPLDFATHFKRAKAAAFLREKQAKTGEELKTEGK